MSEELVTIASIGNGAILELFERELKRVLANIADVNTSPKAMREITIKVSLKPDDESRGVAAATLEVKSKLAPAKPVKSVIYIGKKDNELVAVTNNIQQPSIFDTEKPTVAPLTAFPGGRSAS